MTGNDRPQGHDDVLEEGPEPSPSTVKEFSRAEELRGSLSHSETMDKLKDKLKSAAIVLSAVNDGKVSLIAGVTSDLTGKLKAGELVNFVAQQVGGKGGGRPDMAQAGGTQPEALPQALAGVADWVRAKVGQDAG